MISVTVIANKSKFNIETFYKEENDNKKHHNILFEFCETNGIEYDKNDIYKSLAEQDFIVIITSDNPMLMAATYLPAKINMEQKIELEERKDFFRQFDYLDFFTKISDSLDISIKPGIDKDLMLDYFYEELEKYYNEEMGDRLAIGVIIPNEKILDVGVFYVESRTKDYGHEHMVKDFIEKYHLTEQDEYDLVASGHIFLRIIDNLVIAYMPSSITDLQFERLSAKRKLLQKFPCFSANFFNNRDLIIENTFGEYETNGKDIIDCFYEEIREYYGLGVTRK